MAGFIDIFPVGSAVKSGCTCCSLVFSRELARTEIKSCAQNKKSCS